jgi:DNA-binding GntR family transcriptional regulator
MLVETIERLRTEYFAPLDVLYRSYRLSDRSEEEDVHHAAVNQHANILKAIEAKDGRQAAARMWGHIEATKRALGRLLGEEGITTPATRAYAQLVGDGQQQPTGE